VRRVAWVLALVVAGCVPGGQTADWPIRTPHPLPAGAVAVPLTTDEPAAPLPSGSNGWICATGGYVPSRIVWNRGDNTIEFIVVATDTPLELIWPRGFSAYVQGGRLAIAAPDGTVIGRDGDVLSSLGGAGGAICQVGSTVYEPAR
jgi:hypothetical protein